MQQTFRKLGKYWETQQILVGFKKTYRIWVQKKIYINSAFFYNTHWYHCTDVQSYILQWNDYFLSKHFEWYCRSYIVGRKNIRSLETSPIMSKSNCLPDSSKSPPSVHQASTEMVKAFWDEMLSRWHLVGGTGHLWYGQSCWVRWSLWLIGVCLTHWLVDY